jgi:hypothetical protein
MTTLSFIPLSSMVPTFVLCHSQDHGLITGIHRAEIASGPPIRSSDGIQQVLPADNFPFPHSSALSQMAGQSNRLVPSVTFDRLE